MKKQINLQLLAIFTGGLLFNFLFWNEGLGLNLLLYTLFIIVLIFAKQENGAKKRIVVITLTHLFAAILVVLNHSILNIISYYITLIIFVGFVHAKQIKSVFIALCSGFLQLASSPFNLVKSLINVKVGNLAIKPLLRPIKYIIIPIGVLIFFSIIYSTANPVFAKYAELFLKNIIHFITNVFSFLFGDLSFVRFLHVILGVLFTAGMLLAFKENSLEKFDVNSSEMMTRKRKTRFTTTFIDELKAIFFGSLISKKLALKTEYIVGLISFTALNLLLLILNVIDFNTLWIGDAINNSDTYLSTQLHAGANSLIFSVFMAMLVILYFFSGNLNFYIKNKPLKVLVYAWIIQNTFLVFSVLIRDYHYISLSGLTYKRIGVFVFLILCVIGLITVYVKVAKLKTFYYLCRINGLVWYILLLGASLVNWDVLISCYNINNRDKIALDVAHLMEMSSKTLPILAKNREMLSKYASKSDDYNYTDTESRASVVIDTPTDNSMVQVKQAEAYSAAMKKAHQPQAKVDSATLKNVTEQKRIKLFNEDLDLRIERFKEHQESLSWLSWNYQDWLTAKYFDNK